MAMYSNQLQPALQNLLQRVVRFFHPRLSCTTHISADIQRITLNASCMTISGGRTEQVDIIAGFLPRHWLYEWFSQFHSCGTYSVLSRSHSNGYKKQIIGSKKRANLLLQLMKEISCKKITVTCVYCVSTSKSRNILVRSVGNVWKLWWAPLCPNQNRDAAMTVKWTMGIPEKLTTLRIVHA